MTAIFACNLPIVHSLRWSRNVWLMRRSLVVERAALPMRVLHEAPYHRIARLVDGTHSLDKFRGLAASQTGGGDHAIADIRVDTGHQKSADRAKVSALFLVA